MDNIYFYKPDGKFKYLNKVRLWVVAQLVDRVDEKKRIRKWMRPLWGAALNQKGIVIYVSRLDAEISALNLKRSGEQWKVYSLDDFNIREMMIDCKNLTGNDKYHFLFSFGFWVNDNGNLTNKKGWLSQTLYVNTFTVNENIESEEQIIINFDHEIIKSIFNVWNNKIPSMPEYERYLEKINQYDSAYIESQAINALNSIEKDTEQVRPPDIAAIWNPTESKWIYTNPNNSIN